MKYHVHWFIALLWPLFLCTLWCDMSDRFRWDHHFNIIWSNWTIQLKCNTNTIPVPNIFPVLLPRCSFKWDRFSAYLIQKTLSRSRGFKMKRDASKDAVLKRDNKLNSDELYRMATKPKWGRKWSLLILNVVGNSVITSIDISPL